MQERKPGCICELDPKTGEPVDAHYEECQIHKPDAPDPNKEAERIYNRFMDQYQYPTMSDYGKNLSHGHCKKDAIYVVEEILNVLDTFQRHEYGKILIPFYKEVRDAIEKL